jgi:hypothetical protein
MSSHTVGVIKINYDTHCQPFLIHSPLLRNPPSSVATLPPDQQSNVLVMPAEIPFVPAEQRTTLTPSTAVVVSTQSDPVIGIGDSDTVVIGRKREKKKSKKLQQSTSHSSSQGKTSRSQSANHLAREDGKNDEADETQTPEVEVDSRGREEEEIVTFDFSSIPNILDNNDDETSNGASAQKLTKKQRTRDKAKRSKGNVM